MAGNRKEYTMFLQLKAALGSGFSGTFMNAINTTKKLQNTISDTKRVQNDISGYEKQEEALKKNQDELKKIQSEYIRLQNEERINGNVTTDLKKRYEQNEKQLQKTSTAIQENEKKLADLRTELQNAGVNTDNLTNENKKLKDSYEELKKSQEKIAEISAAQDMNASAISATEKALFKTVGAYTAAGAAVYKGAIEPAIEFESAFAGVKKTVDGTPEELAAIREEILRMSVNDLPATANEIAAVAEAAGQLAVKRENITAFSKTMIDIGESTNLSALEAVENFAKLSNVTGMSQDDFNNLGSVVVELGNNFATTERDIVDMSMRLAGAGTQIGLSEAEIMAYSAALSSVGISAEMGGTAFSKTMINMKVAAETGMGGATEAIGKTGMTLKELEYLSETDGKEFKALAESIGYTKNGLKDFMSSRRKLEDFSSVLGVTAEEFAEMFNNNASDAISGFVVGLSKMDEEGMGAIVTLDEMGITETRLRDTLLLATNAQELFTDAQIMANRAWEDNTALANEAAQRYETTESKIQMTKNAIDELGIVTGGLALPVVQKLAGGLSDMVREATSFVRENPETVKQIADMAIKIGGASTAGLGLLLTGLKLQKGFLGIAKGVTTVKTAFQLANVAKEGKKFSTFASTFSPLTKGLGLYTGVAAGAIVVTAAVVAAMWAQHKAAIAAAKAYSDNFLYNTGGVKLSELTKALKESTSDSLSFAKSINDSGEELKLIKDDIINARREVELYGTVLRDDGILSPSEAERLKEPFETLVTALEDDFRIRYDNVFLAFKDAAIRTADDLGVNIAEIETILDNFKNRHNESVSESRMIISTYLDKKSVGDETSSDEDKSFKEEMAYLNDLAKIKSEAYREYQNMRENVSSIDFGKNQKEAIQNLNDFQSYAEEYLLEIDNAQKQLKDDYKELINIVENDFKYNKKTLDEYNAEIDALNTAQSITNEQYIKDRESFVTEASEIMTEAQKALNIAKYELAEAADDWVIDFRAGMQSVFDYISENIFGYYNGETYENRQNQYKREAAEKEYSEHQVIINETKTILQSEPVRIYKNVPVENEYTNDENYQQVKAYAKGGIIMHPTLATFAEEYPEAAIPINNSARSKSLWQKTGELLGMKTRSEEITLQNINPPTLFESSSSGNEPSISINYNPTIYIDGNKPNDIEDKLKQSTDSILDMVKEYIRQERENERRMAYN